MIKQQIKGPTIKKIIAGSHNAFTNLIHGIKVGSQSIIKPGQEHSSFLNITATNIRKDKKVIVEHKNEYWDTIKKKKIA